MRLWHESLLPKLPRQQLLGQWRECIALLGNGWGRKHKTVDYVFTYSDRKLMKYTDKIFLEMIKRGYKPNVQCITDALMRRYDCDFRTAVNMFSNCYDETSYPEHDESYLRECLENLRNKNIIIEME